MNQKFLGKIVIYAIFFGSLLPSAFAMDPFFPYSSPANMPTKELEGLIKYQEGLINRLQNSRTYYPDGFDLGTSAQKGKIIKAQQEAMRKMTMEYEKRYAARKAAEQAAKFGTLKAVGKGLGYIVPPAAAISNGYMLSDIFGDSIRKNFDALTGSDTVGTKIKADMKRKMEKQEQELKAWREKNPIIRMVPHNPNPNF